MKVSELEGARLDYAVAKALGYVQKTLEITREVAWFEDSGFKFVDTVKDWHPSEKWEQGGPIIDRDHISIRHRDSVNFSPVPDEWSALCSSFAMWGQTALMAAMRAKVVSVYGDTLPDGFFDGATPA